jgi:hypothetical protein
MLVHFLLLRRNGARRIAALLGCEDGVSTLDGGIIGGQTSDVNSIGQRVKDFPKVAWRLEIAARFAQGQVHLRGLRF